MARRRMLDPNFLEDLEVKKLSRDERLLTVGCVLVSDDEGRFQADSTFLKSKVFMYDSDIGPDSMNSLFASMLSKMSKWSRSNPWLILTYISSEENYGYFPNWSEQQKPSHPTPSKLPSPPSLVTPESLANNSETSPEQFAPSIGEGRGGKSSQVKDSIVKDSTVSFADVKDNENELTDLLTTTLEKNISVGRARVAESTSTVIDALDDETLATVNSRYGAEVIKQAWISCIGSPIPDIIFEGASKTLRTHPVNLVAKVFAKGIRYNGGAHRTWKYFQKIIDEETGATK